MLEFPAVLLFKNLIKKKEGGKMKTIFLTGGTGFLGSRLALKSLENGYKVKFLARGRDGESAKDRVEKALKFWDDKFSWNPGLCEVAEGDVTSSLPKVGGVDAVIHSAATVSFREKEREQIFKINFEGTRNILAAALKKDIPFHYISTAYVCGDKEGIIYENELGCGKKFHNPYEESKFMAEKMIRETMRYLPSTIYRPSIIVGDSVTGKTSTFTGYYGVFGIFNILKERYKNSGHFSGKNGKVVLPARAFCHLASQSNLIPINHAVDAIFALFQKKESIGKTFHITNQNPPNFGELFENSMKILGIEGFKLIDTKNAAETEVSPKDKVLKQIERIVKSEWEPYWPYITLKRDFDCRNVRELFGDDFKSDPIVGLTLEKILEYAVKENFGRKGGI